jgi:hypothetical protein
MYAEGQSLAKVGREFGVDAGTVRAPLREQGYGCGIGMTERPTQPEGDATARPHRGGARSAG